MSFVGKLYQLKTEKMKMLHDTLNIDQTQQQHQFTQNTHFESNVAPKITDDVDRIRRLEEENKMLDFLINSNNATENQSNYNFAQQLESRNFPLSSSFHIKQNVAFETGVQTTNDCQNSSSSDVNIVQQKAVRQRRRPLEQRIKQKQILQYKQFKDDSDESSDEKYVKQTKISTVNKSAIHKTQKIQEPFILEIQRRKKPILQIDTLSQNVERQKFRKATNYESQQQSLQKQQKKHVQLIDGKYLICDELIETEQEKAELSKLNSVNSTSILRKSGKVIQTQNKAEKDLIKQLNSNLELDNFIQVENTKNNQAQPRVSVNIVAPPQFNNSKLTLNEFVIQQNDNSNTQHKTTIKIVRERLFYNNAINNNQNNQFRSPNVKLVEDNDAQSDNNNINLYYNQMQNQNFDVKMNKQGFLHFQ